MSLNSSNKKVSDICDQGKLRQTYSSRENHNLIAEAGATPHITFKKKATAKPNGPVARKKIYHYFMLNNEEYMQHYPKRSNAETTIHMINRSSATR